MADARSCRFELAFGMVLALTHGLDWLMVGLDAVCGYASQEFSKLTIEAEERAAGKW
jgi:hypothetical protein